MSKTREQAEELDREYKALLVDMFREALTTYLQEDREDLNAAFREATDKLRNETALLARERERSSNASDRLRESIDGLRAHVSQAAAAVTNLQKSGDSNAALVSSVSREVADIAQRTACQLKAIEKEHLEQIAQLDTRTSGVAMAVANLGEITTKRIGLVAPEVADAIRAAVRQLETATRAGNKDTTDRVDARAGEAVAAVEKLRQTTAAGFALVVPQVAEVMRGSMRDLDSTIKAGNKVMVGVDARVSGLVTAVAGLQERFLKELDQRFAANRTQQDQVMAQLHRMSGGVHRLFRFTVLLVIIGLLILGGVGWLAGR